MASHYPQWAVVGGSKWKIGGEQWETVQSENFSTSCGGREGGKEKQVAKK